jgi:hypothetical protein
VKPSSRPPWFWKLLLLVSIVLAVDFLVEDKFYPLILIVLWIAGLSVSIARMRRQRA